MKVAYLDFHCIKNKLKVHYYNILASIHFHIYTLLHYYVWYVIYYLRCGQECRKKERKIITFAVHVIFLILIQKVVIRGCTGDCKMRIICTPAILCLMSFSIKSNVAKRGPHHPKSEIDKGRQKMDEHFAHGVE